MWMIVCHLSNQINGKLNTLCRHKTPQRAQRNTVKCDQVMLRCDRGVAVNIITTLQDETMAFTTVDLWWTRNQLQNE